MWDPRGWNRRVDAAMPPQVKTSCEKGINAEHVRHCSILQQRLAEVPVILLMRSSGNLFVSRQIPSLLSSRLPKRKPKHFNAFAVRSVGNLACVFISAWFCALCKKIRLELIGSFEPCTSNEYSKAICFQPFDKNVTNDNWLSRAVTHPALLALNSVLFTLKYRFSRQKGVRPYDCGSRIGEEDEDLPGSPASVRRASDASARERDLEEARQSSDSPLGKTKIRDSDNAMGIVIKVEDFGADEVTRTDADDKDKKVEKEREETEKSSARSEKGPSQACKEGEEDEAKMANIEAVMKAISDNIPVAKSPDCSPADSACDGAAKSGSPEESNAGCKVASEAPRARENADRCLKTSGAEELVPKRKKSLTWSENTQTIESGAAERDLSRRNSEADDPDKCLRDSSRRPSASSRPSSRNSERSRGRNSRSGDLGDISGRRRSSTASTYSARKGSETFQTLPGPRREHRSLSTSSASSSRRNSRRSIKDEAEVETLLARSPDGRSDVTLASILNHIAYVNQAASSAKLPSSLKDSRKAQVQQVLLVTYVTAALGTLLSLALVYGVYGHFSAVNVFARPPWLWFAYESSCRFLEFLMGCAMANITRQPVNRHPQYPYSLRLKQRNSLYM
ncbi:uncharacterized protein LOC119577350 [Penaeus monodon]|uniref:uncharacterized protein LOC119577350 n=1 Tax=Penaeus monodon TaxID=6687 RepID=UPI0018A6E1C2|nr:uncharacterized protein LOC119577350 [Penaeus monodon]